MNTKQIILNKLKNARKESLSKKVDLSLVDDLDREFDWLETTYSDASYGPSLFEEWIDKIQDFNSELSLGVDNFVVNGTGYQFEDQVKNMKPKIEELEIKAEELGINPSDLVRNYEEIKSILMDSDAIIEEYDSSYRELLREANERFGLANFS